MNEMTSLERVQAVLAGQIPDRLPVVPQGFMFAAATAGYQIGQINRSPEKMAESHRISREKYGYDGCVIDVDDATLAEACGASVIYRDNDVAAVDDSKPLLKNLRDVDDLVLPDPYKSGRICEWLETSQRLMEKVGDHTFVMGRADQGPFSLLCLLRGAQHLMVDLMLEDKEVVLHALEWATKAHTAFARAQLKIAHATSMGDAYASPNLISPDMYRTFGLPFEQQVTAGVADLNKPYSVHICGDTNKIIEDMGKCGSQILEVDWKLDMGVARKAVPDNVVLMGNIDPSFPMYTGKPEEVLAGVQDMLNKTKGRGLIISSGCALGANTPPENMAALVESAKLYATHDQIVALQA